VFYNITKTDAFVLAFEQLASGKAKLLDEVRASLTAASDLTSIAQILRTSADRFRHFTHSVNLPFESQFAERKASASDSGKAETH